MKKIKKLIPRCILYNNNGFAIIAALMALLIITAVGALVFTLSTQDIRVSTRVVGEKKAFSAAQAGIHKLSEYSNLNAGLITDHNPSNQQVDSSADPSSIYSAINSTIPHVPASVNMSTYNIAGGNKWGQTITGKRVIGENTRYKSKVEIDVGVGYGPIPIGTEQPAAGG